MKKSILFSVLLVLSVLFTSQAVVRTVSNDGFTPAQYSDLQVAIDASNSGDTLYVHGSTASYGDILITKKVTLVGNGVNTFDGTKRSILGTVYLSSPTAGATDGVTFLGMDISSITFCNNNQGGSGGYKISNTSIIRSIVRRVEANAPAEGTGESAVFLLQCPQIGIINLNNFSSLIVQNSNFLGNSGIQGGSVNGAYIFNNCLFFGIYQNNYSYENGLGNNGYTLKTALFQNCIFANWHFVSLAGCIFNKCLTYTCNDDNISATGAILTNCLTGQDPLFVLPPNYGYGTFQTDAQWFDPSYSNCNFATGSPCINAGLDGKNLGPTGGSNPFNYLTQSAPQIPRMKEVTVLSGQTLGTTGGTIQVQIKAKRQD